MITINYKKTSIITKEYGFDINDIKNVFLKGNDEQFNRICYFGLWQYEKGFKKIIIEDRNISFDYSVYSSANTEIDIRRFLTMHHSVEVISKESFFNELKNIKDFLIE